MKRVFVLNDPFAAEQSRGTICQIGEQMTQWYMLKKANKFESLCLSLFEYSIRPFTLTSSSADLICRKRDKSIAEE